jgi:transcriptional regulator NrdR family protein
MNGSTPNKGLECRKCGCRHFRVLYTRSRPGKLVRRRECRHCGTRITTWEQAIGTIASPSASPTQ